LRSPKLAETIAASGATVVGSTPAAFAQVLREEIVKWGKVAKAAGLKPQ